MLEKIKKLRENRYTYREIGSLLGVSKQYIHQIYKKYNTIPTNGKLHSAVLIRDNNSCQMCGKTDFQTKLFVHHINKKNGNVIENLITLCKKCHGIAHRWINKRENKIRKNELSPLGKKGRENRKCKKCGQVYKGHQAILCKKKLSP